MIKKGCFRPLCIEHLSPKGEKLKCDNEASYRDESIIDETDSEDETWLEQINDQEHDEAEDFLAIENINKAKQYGEGFMGGGASQGIVKDSADSNLPRAIKFVMNFMLCALIYIISQGFT